MDILKPHHRIEAHVRGFFEGHRVEPRQWTKGPARERLPNLRVLEIGPGPRSNLWTYVTVGAWNRNDDNPFEYLMISDRARTRFVELLTIVAFYSLSHNLGCGHTIPIGEPLVDGSACEHVYLSLPYTFGPKLELLPVSPRQGHILWVFPITASEKRHLLEDGQDALEERFERRSVEYWSPFRPSVA